MARVWVNNVFGPFSVRGVSVSGGGVKRWKNLADNAEGSIT